MVSRNNNENKKTNLSTYQWVESLSIFSIRIVNNIVPSPTDKLQKRIKIAKHRVKYCLKHDQHHNASNGHKRVTRDCRPRKDLTS